MLLITQTNVLIQFSSAKRLILNKSKLYSKLAYKKSIRGSCADDPPVLILTLSSLTKLRFIPSLSTCKRQKVKLFKIKLDDFLV